MPTLREMERLINGSVTAKSSAGMLSRFLIGQGFKEESLNKIIVGKDRYERPITAFKLLRQIAVSTAFYAGYYVRAQFDGNLKTTALAHTNFKHCRFGLKDSQDYSGMVVIYDNWDRSKSNKVNKKDFLKVNVWNPREAVISAQIEKAGSHSEYKGQVYFNFLDEYFLYPLAPIDPVLYDADTEKEISRFKNGELRRGFFMKYIIHHSMFESEKDAKDFQDKMDKMIGGGHQLSSMILPGTFNDDGTLNKEENISVEKIEQNINDKIFETYEKSVINNIRKAYHAIPQILIDYEDGKLGTTSGEALFQASSFYNQMTGELRKTISESFVEMFLNWHTDAAKGQTWEIEPLELGIRDEQGGNMTLAIPLKKEDK